MDNFFKEHKRYAELYKKLEKQNLEDDLIMVVGDAIQHGIAILSEKILKRGDKNE